MCEYSRPYLQADRDFGDALLVRVLGPLSDGHELGVLGVRLKRMFHGLE